VRRCASSVAAAVLVAAVAGCGGGDGAPSGGELARLARPPVATSLASQRIYFVLPDRYANGDPSNDRGGLTGSRERTGFDPTDSGYYHGGDLAGLQAGLRRIKALGFTALWITPVVKQKYVQTGSAAYHGYWGLDFTTVDPHLGTERDFAAFAAAAHRLGLKVYLDVVVNHTADVIFIGSGYSDAPYRDCKGRVFDPARYAGGKTFPCLSAGEMPHSPLLPDEDAHLKQPEWLNDVTAYHDRGDIDFESCDEQCYEQGDFFGLDDLFTEQPRVVDGLAAVYGAWIRRYKVDGFRVDTARHVDSAFFRAWVPKIRATARAAGVRDFQIFGEIFDDDSTVVSSFVRDRGLPNVLDFPFQAVAAAYAGGGSSALGLQHRFEDDDYYRTPAGIAVTPATFLGNHDMGRAALKISENGGAKGTELLRRVLLGYDLLYLLRGAPVVYYGDEAGLVGTGGDKAARQDLFIRTRVRDWKAQPRLDGASISRELRHLARLRDELPALSRGATNVLFAKEGTLVVSRVDLRSRREVVVAFNNTTSPTHVTVRPATRTANWTSPLGVRASRAAGGRLTVTIPALGATVLVASGLVPDADPPTPSLAFGDDDLTELKRVRARVGGDVPVTVAFATRRRGGDWTRLAVDDSRPFRAFLDPRKFARGERVEVVAIARSPSGKTARSKVLTVVPRR
jgi:alpha-amylase